MKKAWIQNSKSHDTVKNKHEKRMCSDIYYLEPFTMRRTKASIIFISLIFAFSCTRSRPLIEKKGGESTELSNIYKLGKIHYDTLEGLFLYESYVESYIAGEDVVTKAGGLIKGSVPVDLNTYKNGYHLCDFDLLKKYENANPSLKSDSTSVISFQSHLNEIYWTHSGNNETQFNPFCGLFYTKFLLKAAVVNIGDVQQKTPLFVDCEDFDKHKKTNNGIIHEDHSLTTFLITDVISLEKIN